jgi:hypothetical protein
MLRARAPALALIMGVLGISAPARGDDEPRHFVCSFLSGSSWSYDGGSFKTAAPAPLSFEITDIDLDAQSAHLVTDGRDKPGTLKIVRAINANHFLEVMNEGFLNLTTVYDKDASTGTYPAVHSRHFGLIGQPVFAQYAGTCQAK